MPGPLVMLFPSPQAAAAAADEARRTAKVLRILAPPESGDGQDPTEPVADVLGTDDRFVCAMILRNGGAVLVAEPGSSGPEGLGQAFSLAGGTLLDDRLKARWLGVEDAVEQAHARAVAERGKNLDREVFRRGFVSSLAPFGRARSWPELLEDFRRNHSGEYLELAFQNGFAAGQKHSQGSIDVNRP